MAKQISTQKLVNELENAVKQSKVLLKVQTDLSKVINETAKDLKEGFKGVSKDTTKGLSEFNNLLKETNKLLKAEEKNNEKKKDTETDLIKQQQELSKLRKLESQERQTILNEQKKERAEKEKALKQFQKEEKAREDANDQYKVQSKRLNDLRKEYKQLAVQNKANTKEAKTLLKEITKLDKKLKDVDETVGQNQRNVGNYTKALSKMNSTIGKLGIVAVITKGFELLSNAFGDSRNGAEAMQLAMNKLTVTMGVLGKRFGMLASNLQNILSNDSLSMWDKLELAMDSFGDSFKGVGEEIDKVTKGMENQIKLATKYSIKIQELERQLSVLQRTQKVNLLIAENDTLSFEARQRASDIAVKSAKEYGKVLREQSRLQLESNALEIGAKIGLDKLDSETTEAYSNRIRKKLKDETVARQISDDLERQFTESYKGYQEDKLESDDMYLDALEKQNKLYSDLNEVELDLELDLLDNLKTINEKKIASDKYTIEERRKLLEKTSTDFNDLFKDQLETVIKQRNRVIETEKERLKIAKQNGDISKEQYDQEIKNFNLQKEKLTIENLTNIALNENTQEQIEQVKALKLGEKFTLRYSEIIRDYRTGVLDLKEAQEQLNDLQNEKSLKKEEDYLNKKRELYEATSDLISDYFKNGNDKINKELDNEITATQKRIEQLTQAAKNGNEEAKKSLAEEEKKAAELELKKEQQRKKEVVQEKIIAGLKLLGENSSQPNALGKTISDVFLLTSLLKGVPAFIDGTERVSDGVNGATKVHNGTDGYLARFDGMERIMNPNENSDLNKFFGKDIANSELVDLAKLGAMSQPLNYSPIVAQNNKGVENKLDKVINELSNLPNRMPQQRYDYDAASSEHIQTIKSNNKTERLRTKAKNQWR